MRYVPPYNTPILIEGFVNQHPEGHYSWIMKPTTFEIEEGGLDALIEHFAECIQELYDLPRSKTGNREGKFPLPSRKPASSTRSIWAKAKKYHEAGDKTKQYKYFRAVIAEWFTVNKKGDGAYHWIGPVEIYEGADLGGQGLEQWQALWKARLPYSTVISPDENAVVMNLIRECTNDTATHYAVRHTSTNKKVAGFHSYEDARAFLDRESAAFMPRDGSQFGVIWCPPEKELNQVLTTSPGQFVLVTRLC